MICEGLASQAHLAHLTLAHAASDECVIKSQRVQLTLDHQRQS
jgi:hypothetical protein